MSSEEFVTKATLLVDDNGYPATLLKLYRNRQGLQENYCSPSTSFESCYCPNWHQLF